MERAGPRAKLLQGLAEKGFGKDQMAEMQRVIDAVGDSRVALGILPAGTANLFATNLGIPKDLEGAVHTALHGVKHTLDVGVVNGERFAVMAGAGFDAVMIKEADGTLHLIPRAGVFASKMARAYDIMGRYGKALRKLAQ